MSQNFYIDGILKIGQPMSQIDRKYWSQVLKAAIYDPKKALEKGIKAAIKDYKGDGPEFFGDCLEYGDEFEEIDDDDTDIRESGENDEETEDTSLGDHSEVPTFTLGMDIVLSGCYCLEDYIDNANKVVYQAGVEKGGKVCLKIEHTFLDRGPDDDVTMKWHEMVEKFGRNV